MEYEVVLVHNMPDIAYNAVFVALKFVNNVLHVMLVLDIATQPTTPFNPAADLPCTLLRMPNSPVIKKVYIPSNNLKVIK